MNKFIAKNQSSTISLKPSKGFSAVELLVTLFVALLFLSMGYALYGTIVTASSQNRHRAQADNIAFEYLRRYESTALNPCVVSTPVSNVTVTGATAAELASPKVTVNITCPNSSVTLLSLIKVTITYQEGGSQRNVYHEVYASV